MWAPITRRTTQHLCRSFKKSSNLLAHNRVPIAYFCASAATNGTQQSSSVAKAKFEDTDDSYGQDGEEGGQISWVRVFFVFAGFAAAGVGIYQLWPGKLSAGNVSNRAFEMVKHNEDIKYICGDNLKSFGRDTGRNEGE